MGGKPARPGRGFFLLVTERLTGYYQSLPMPDRHILLVEDDPDSAHLAMQVFKQIAKGTSIRHVSDGVEALDYLEGRDDCAGDDPRQPVVVLLDLKMPRMDGFEVLQRLKAKPDQRLHRVVVLSSSDHEGDVQRAYALGASGYVVKPIEFDNYRSTLQAIWDFWGVHNEPPRIGPAAGTHASLS